jgi:hypothetical protein
MSVTIHNAATGNPTQVTVYADGDGSTIHDVAPSVFGYVEEAVSTAINIAAALTQQPELYLAAAAAIDGAQAGQAFSQGRVLQGVLSLAQAVAAGVNVAGYASTGQVISAAAEGVGNAAGLRIYQGGQAQALLKSISTALTSAGVATTVASLWVRTGTSYVPFHGKVVQGWKTIR